MRAGGVAEVQVDADRVVALLREPAHDLLRLSVVTGHVVDHQDPATRSGSQGTGRVGLDEIVAVPSDPHRLGEHRVVAHPEVSFTCVSGRRFPAISG